MSALWIPGRAGVSPGFLVAQPGAVAVWNHRHSCLRPCVICRTQPRHPGPITRHQRHDLKHRALSGARAKARRSWFDADPARIEPALPCSCPESVYSTRVGIYWPRVVRTARRPHLPEVPPTLVQWHPALVQCIQTTPAATRATASSRAGPTREASSGSHTRSAHPTSVLRCQDIRNSQKS